MKQFITKYKFWILLISIVSLSIIIGLLIASRADGSTQPKKGLAMAMTQYAEDRTSLKVDWWYAWGEYCGSDNTCVNMVREMQQPKQCYPLLLVGNEPNAREPYGASISPRDAVTKSLAIKSQCSNTIQIIGNVSADDWGNGDGYTWLSNFLYEYKKATGKKYDHILGAHCYTQHLASYCQYQLGRIRKLYAGSVWVTEFGVMSGDAGQFKTLVDYIANNFERYAAYTNRQPHSGQGWEVSTGVELVNSDGTLTAIGKVYATR